MRALLVRCLLILKSPDAPCLARYLVWVLYYIPYVGLDVSVSEFLVLPCLTVFRIILRLQNLVFRIFNVYGLRLEVQFRGPIQLSCVRSNFYAFERALWLLVMNNHRTFFLFF